MTGSKEGLSPAGTEEQGGPIPPILRNKETPTTHVQRDPLGQKGRRCQAIRSLDNHPAMLCFGIHLGQKMHTQIREGPWVWSGVKESKTTD